MDVVTLGLRLDDENAAAKVREFGNASEKAAGQTTKVEAASARATQGLRDQARTVQQLTRAQQMMAENPALQQWQAQNTTALKATGNATRMLTQETRAATLMHMRANAMNEAFGKTATVSAASTARSSIAVGRLGNQFGSLASTLAGVHPVFANVAGVLGNFAIGSGLMVGVMLGLAALAKAWELITAKSREAKKVQDEAVERLEELAAQQRQGALGTTPQEIIAAGTRMGEIMALLAEPSGGIDRFGEQRGLSDKRRAALQKELDGLVRFQEAGFEKIRQVDREGRAKTADEQAKAYKSAEQAQKEHLEELQRNAQEAWEQIEKTMTKVPRNAPWSAGSRDAWDVMVGGGGGAAVIPTFDPMHQRTPDDPYASEGGVRGVFNADAGLKQVGAANNMREFADMMSKAGGLGEMFTILKDSAGMLAKTVLPLVVLFKVFEGVMKPLRPAFEALAAPLHMFGEIIGKALVPVLALFWPALKAAAIGASYVAEVFLTVSGWIMKAVGWLVEGIAKFVNKIIPFGDPLKGMENAGRALAEAGGGLLQGAQDMGKFRDELRDMTFGDALKGATEAVQAFTAAMTNVPTGYKVDLRRFQATQGVAMLGAQQTRTSAGPTNVIINVTQLPNEDGPALAKRIAYEFRQVKLRGGVPEYDL